jgi:hypothetical protein
MPNTDNRTVLREDAYGAGPLVDGALIAVGALAIVDNVMVHWILGWHRLVDGWNYNVHGEVALIALGTMMVAAGTARVRRRRS